MFRKVISVVVISMLQVLPALAQDRVTILILDESGSMWAQLPEGRSRIEVARDVLGDFMALRDPAAPLGVVAYGHNRRGDCSDIETITPVQPQDATALTARLRALMPRGKTPLADALRHAAAEIPQTAEEANIVLVTDGLETCGGDPCAVAAELSSMGIPVQAHVVGFGLTEGEVRQIACVAEQTGGLVLAPQSGEELVDALIRTSQPVTRAPQAPGSAALNLSIRADIAGRPDAVDFTGESLETGEIVPFGRLDFATASALAVDMAEGRWLIRADAGEMGRGEVEIDVFADDNRTIYVPFQGIMPDLDLPDPTGAFRAGINGLIPYRINQEGLATGGGDFVLSVLPVDATTTTDRRYDYATQDVRVGGHVGMIRVPPEPGQYLIAFHRNASQPINEVLRSFVITVVERPEIILSAPDAVEPGARVPVSISGGMGNSDRIEIWRDGALSSWDQSVYMQDFFDNGYGPAKPLLAPVEPGTYEIIYVFSEINGPEAVGARVPLTVGAVTDLEEASIATDTGETRQADLSDGVGYSCDQPICMITDAQTGLSFALPQGWFTDMPTLEAYTTGGQPGTPRVTFLRKVGENVDTIVLNPRQWTLMNGPCQDLVIGQLCVFEGEFHDPSVAALLAQTLRWQAPAEYDDSHAPDEDPLRQHAALVCEDQLGCLYQDDALQFSVAVPNGWSMTDPARAAIPAKDGHAPLRVTFFSKMEVPDRIVLNPEGWSDADGVCVSLQAGALCHAASGSDMLAPGLDFLRRTIVDSAPRRLPPPEGAIADAIADLAAEDHDAAAAMGALFGTAREMTKDEGHVPDASDMMEAVIGTLFNPQDAGRLPPPDTTAASGIVLHNCGMDGPCVFEQPDLAISGALPPGWQVEVAVQRPDLHISTWFTARDPAGNIKRLGLNQPQGEHDDCVATALGRLCQETPYVSTQEHNLITRSLGYGLAGDVRQRLAAGLGTSSQATTETIDGLLQMLGGK